MSQSISSKGIFPLSSGNILRWYREDIPGNRGGIRADFRSQPSHRDTKEAKHYMQSLVPGGATALSVEPVEVIGAQRTKSLIDAFLGRGNSN